MKKYLGLLLLFVLDRLLKYFAVYRPSVLQSLGGFIDIRINPQMAFSLPLWNYLYYPAIFVIFILLVYFWYKSFTQKKAEQWAWALIIIGAMSNILDRIYQGGVIDFISLSFISVFNISDVYIVLGVLWLLFSIRRQSRAEEQLPKSS